MPLGMGPAGWYMWPYMAYGMRRWYPQWAFPPYGAPWLFSPQEEKTFLENQARMLEDQLVQIKKRLTELKKQEKEKK